MDQRTNEWIDEWTNEPMRGAFETGDDTSERGGGLYSCGVRGGRPHRTVQSRRRRWGSCRRRPTEASPLWRNPPAPRSTRGSSPPASRTDQTSNRNSGVRAGAPEAASPLRRVRSARRRPAGTTSVTLQTARASFRRSDQCAGASPTAASQPWCGRASGCVQSPVPTRSFRFNRST